MRNNAAAVNKAVSDFRQEADKLLAMVDEFRFECIKRLQDNGSSEVKKDPEKKE